MDTFVTVEKDGIEDRFPANVWQKMGGSINKYGWKLVSSTPPEVEELARKKTVEIKPLRPEGEVEEIKEVKSKGRPKSKV